jgi:hypothetical protein
MQGREGRAATSDRRGKAQAESLIPSNLEGYHRACQGRHDNPRLGSPRSPTGTHCGAARSDGYSTPQRAAWPLKVIVRCLLQ